MTAADFLLREFADGSLLVEYPGLSDEEANSRAVAAAGVLERKAPPGFLDAVPGARTLLVLFDPALTDSESLAPLLSPENASDPAQSRRALRIPVVYGSEAGADLPEVARRAQLSVEEFTRRHASARYRVAFLGFAPGFAYLTGLPPELAAPRLPTPRMRVEAGAVAIGGSYTGIYPGETPGGWRLIGRAPVRLFDPQADLPTLFLPGDEVGFEPVTQGEFDRVHSTLAASRRLPEHSISGPALLRVLAPGVFSSVQGAPRYGWSRYGVPPGGAIDPESLAYGNFRLGNPPEAAGLEMTLVGAELEALADTAASLAGASAQVEHNGRPMDAEVPLRLRAGDRLRVARISNGARSYLCVTGGFATTRHPMISPRLTRGDILHSAESRVARVPASRSPRVPHESSAAAGETVVRVVLGPHRSFFSGEAVATFLSSVYRLSASSDRRGLRLEGAPIALAGAPDIPPEGTPLGGIQVAHDGMPIALGPDRPVTGGYARIATVIRADFSLLAQAIPGAAVRFAEVSLAEALAARVG
jgi:KipI family sensor histidine kinase inhibitor